MQDGERQSAVAGGHMDAQENAAEALADKALELREHEDEEGGHAEPIPEHRRIAILGQVDQGMRGQAEKEAQRRKDVKRAEPPSEAKA